jgi:RimJ/RimL family protein N-acetyltransferase
MIGEKSLWGRGIGTEAIGLLVDFGFATEQADAIFAAVAQDNP